ncbi:MAG: hypothetical protein KDK99_19480, partial [Verrucomicrobiales bacterium]|nr:hypothetical protein [Verrucomicrobiales bacterium]
WPSAADFDRLCGRWPYDQATLAPAPQRQPATAALQVGLLLMMLLVGVGCGGHWEDVTHEIGYKGRARTDPFLAAREFLTARGHSVERRWDLSMLPEADMGVVLA